MIQKEPLVSVIVPVYNCRSYLVYSLPAIRTSDYPCFELIIADNHSTDGSRELEEKYADTVLDLDEKWSPGRARNRGVQASRGSILIFIDADVQVGHDTISRIVKTLEENPEVAAVFGSYDEEPFFHNFFSQYKNLFHHFTHQHANTEASTFWTGCGAIRKDIFFETDGFSDSFLEDVELGYQLWKKGKKIRLLKELKVKHLKKYGLFSLLRSDIAHRALPWTRLVFKHGLPYDLNFKASQRISGIISCLLFISLVLMGRWNVLLFVSIVLAGILLYLNRNLYRFFFEKKSIQFTIPAIFWHWFYFLYSSVTFAFISVFLLLKKPFLRKRSNEKENTP
jgi:glycosyltransferase involved in cell wall biosynthesis